jgi:hypothetical protein
MLHLPIIQSREAEHHRPGFPSRGDDPPTAVFHKFDIPHFEFPQEDGMCFGKIWMVESQGELLVICVFFVDFDPDHIGAVHVFKMDFDQHKSVGWNWVLNVRDMTFLLSGNSMATCCSSGRLVMGNAVYFLKNFMMLQCPIRWQYTFL